MNEQLLKILKCPVCASAVSEKTDRILVCSSCEREFKTENAILLFYPDKFDKIHFEEEIKLAKEMKKADETERERISRQQWELSKNEFWAIVKKEIGQSPTSLINIGCGYDDNFKYFQDRQDFFVNFDLVPGILEDLKNKGAKNCVAGDINHLPFSENSFDNLVCIDVIHHESKRLEEVLNSFKNILKPDGKIFLEDVNAWGLFQFYKSIFMPRPLHGLLRSVYHRMKKTAHQPADYEFPTNPFRVKKILEEIGFEEVKFYPLDSYPERGRLLLIIYKVLKILPFIRIFNNFHYCLSAKKKK
jgi:SAM-dependent methyltransferase